MHSLHTQRVREITSRPQNLKHVPSVRTGRSVTRCNASSAGAREPAKAVVTGPSAVARVDVGDAVEQIIVPLSADSNKVITAQLEFPLGLILEGTWHLMWPLTRHAWARMPCASCMAHVISRCIAPCSPCMSHAPHPCCRTSTKYQYNGLSVFVVGPHALLRHPYSSGMHCTESLPASYPSIY